MVHMLRSVLITTTKQRTNQPITAHVHTRTQAAVAEMVDGLCSVAFYLTSVHVTSSSKALT